MNENHLLDVEHWKDVEKWDNYEIPYLFLGYNPKPYDSRPLDDYIVLDGHEQGLYDHYFKLINEAIEFGKLTAVGIDIRGFCSLRATKVIKWRKSKKSIKPVDIYLELEQEIHKLESDDKVNQQDTTTRRTQNQDYNPTSRIGQAMKRIAQLYADKGIVVPGEDMIGRLQKQFGATIRKNDNDYFSYTNLSNNKRKIMTKIAYEKMFTRVRNSIKKKLK